MDSIAPLAAAGFSFPRWAAISIVLLMNDMFFIMEQAAPLEVDTHA
jgi:hypothetical protein